MMVNDSLLTQIDGFVSELCFHGLSAWIYSWEIGCYVINIMPVFQKDVSPDLLQAIAGAKKRGKIEEFNMIRRINHAIIRKVLTDGLMEIGDGYDAGYFKAWPLTVEEALEDVEAEWDNRDDFISWEGTYQLQNTPLGDELGEKAMLQHQQWLKVHPDYYY
jgi:hypothetical protein